MEVTQILTMEDSDDISILLKNWEVIAQLKRDIILNEEKINNKTSISIDKVKSKSVLQNKSAILIKDLYRKNNNDL